DTAKSTYLLSSGSLSTRYTAGTCVWNCARARTSVMNAATRAGVSEGNFRRSSGRFNTSVIFQNVVAELQTQAAVTDSFPRHSHTVRLGGLLKQRHAVDDCTVRHVGALSSLAGPSR